VIRTNTIQLYSWRTCSGDPARAWHTAAPRTKVRKSFYVLNLRKAPLLPLHQKTEMEFLSEMKRGLLAWWWGIGFEAKGSWPET
jgi:hypothetical protein